MSTSAAKVLVVDDEEQVLNLAQIVLRTGGFQVLGAVNGEQALNLMETQAPPVDVVLSDVRMPGMSGPQLVKRIQRSFPATVVTLMTGDSLGEEIDPSIP